MADKRGDLMIRVVGILAGSAAGFATRKLMTAAWKKTTGHEPPDNPEDPEVELAEALGWALVVGLVISTARLLATRTAAKRVHKSASAKPAAVAPEADG